DYAYARQNGGAVVVRVEDTDQARYNPESERRIYQALHWLGLNWDEGPDIGGPYAPYRQSERLALYAEYAHQLISQGSAYYCFCTRERLDAMRKAQEAAKLPPKYDRHCLHLDPAAVQARLATAEPAVVRLRMPDQGETIFHDLVRGPVSFRNELQDDGVILKSDGFPTYHLAVVVDDHLMKITHVVRGEEWISSTPKHVVLYEAFGWPLPAFIHMPLLRNADKSKISKRKNNTSLDWYRDQGYLPAALLNYLALQGWSMPDARETFSLDEFIAAFTWDRIVTGGPIFDLKRLNDLNGQYIRMLSPDRLIDALEPFLPTQVDRSLLPRIVPLVQTRMDRLTQFYELAGFFFAEPAYEIALLTEQRLGAERSHALLRRVRDLLDRLPSWDVVTMEQSFRALTEAEGVKMRQTAEVARVAITGSKAGPPLFESMELLGRASCLARVDHALARINTG
ncbi:MAG: glutamate--tRNA ligase, partial [Chloroflexota bacterium]